MRCPNPTLRLLVVTFACAALLTLLPRPVAAHQGSVTHSRVRLGDDGVVDYTLLVNSRDVAPALGLGDDADATDAELRAGERRLADYVLARITVRADGAACPGALRRLGIVTQADHFAELALRFNCAAAPAKVELDYRLFFDLDTAHVGRLQVTHRDRTITAEFKQGLPPFAWALPSAGAAPDAAEPAPPPSLGFSHFVREGAHHIFTGYDHIAFVLGLLLVVMVRARAGGGFEARPARESTGQVIRTVSAFTVAHSLTLGAAALGWVSLPGAFVESVIAASIVYVAVENIWQRDVGPRLALAFAFGLVHGLGFASLLAPMLPPGGAALPLLAFNLGVELGQLAIVATVMPLLGLFAARAPARYRTVAVIGGSVVVGAMGVLWLVERLLGITTISRVLG